MQVKYLGPRFLWTVMPVCMCVGHGGVVRGGPPEPRQHICVSLSAVNFPTNAKPQLSFYPKL